MILNRFPKTRLFLIGGVSVDSYYQELLELRQALELKAQVEIIPGLEPDDPLLPSAYAAADLFVLPSRQEPFGIVILEAWASHTPVITTNVGGIPGFTRDGRDVLWFESEDKMGLYRALCRLMSDPELKAKLSREGAIRVKPFSWKVTASKYETLYSALIR